MEQHEEIEIQIWEYLDGLSNEQDRKRIMMLIQQDSAWNRKFAEISALHTNIVSDLEMEQPSLRFSKNVMEAIAVTNIAPATKKYINYNLIRGIAGFFIITLALMLFYALATTNWDTGATGFLKVLEKNGIGFEVFFKGNFVNILIAINVVLGLVLVDKILHKRKKVIAENYFNGY